MIMTMAVAETYIMIMVAIKTKNMTINMTKIFKRVQKENFYCLLRIIKKTTKIQFALLLYKIDVFLITQPTKSIG